MNCIDRDRRGWRTSRDVMFGVRRLPAGNAL